MALPFTVLKIEELVDGRVFVEWETVADDGLPLVEGDYLTPVPGESIADCLTRCCDDVKTRRVEINQTPPKGRPKPPARKRSTRTLSDGDVTRLRSLLSNE